MTSLSHALSACLFASLGLLLVDVPSAHACAGEQAVRWLPERSWPAACETDVPTNGFVFLEGSALDAATAGGEGELRVYVERMVDGRPAERLDGEVRATDTTSALFRSARPLAPNADYVLTAQRVSADGTPLSRAFTSAFTTGGSALAALTFRGIPTVQLEAFDKEITDCEADACGVQHCRPTGESAPARYLRIEVPAIDGGLQQRPYAVTAELSAGFGAGKPTTVASAEPATVQSGKRSFMVIEVPALSATTEGCVTVTATDMAGHRVVSEPVCTKLLADADSEELADPEQTASSLQYVSGGGAERASEAGAAASGCAVGSAAGGTGGLGWLGLALLLARVRARKRAA